VRVHDPGSFPAAAPIWQLGGISVADDREFPPMTSEQVLRLSILVAALVPAVTSQSPEPDQDRLRRQLEKKLDEPFVANVEWELDLSAARRRSAESGRPVFAYFTRSYAPCAPCRALEQGVFETVDFAAFARDEVVPFLHVTTRIPGREHDDLLGRYGQSGFPTVLVLDADGRCVAVPAERTIAAFRAALEEARRRITEGDDGVERGPRAAAEAWLRDRRLGNYADLDADRAAFERHRAVLTPDELAGVEHSLAERALADSIRRLEKLGLGAGELDFTAPEVESALFGALAARESLGGWPPGAPSNRALIALLAWADAHDDARLFAIWVEQLREARRGLGGNDEVLGFFAARLEAIRSGEPRGPLLTAFFARAKPRGGR
jgi:hypothetical protein